MHIGVFILLLLSGERNFGVRLNKPYAAAVPMDIPVFTGTHADLLVVVFHKIVTTGHQRLQPLFDCLLTILVNGEWGCFTVPCTSGAKKTLYLSFCLITNCWEPAFSGVPLCFRHHQMSHCSSPV